MNHPSGFIFHLNKVSLKPAAAHLSSGSTGGGEAFYVWDGIPSEDVQAALMAAIKPE
ncbi:hypothetical protein [Variovorax sp. MHTC-1]|uniref:hypothetical protein n=1 Tax=Variovorax sp. MHTC-1 TaxID=2495593 RepID=UPI00163BF746|nr:hypothetical protein [Variovorax sp. MHTC-1]